VVICWDISMRGDQEVEVGAGPSVAAEAAIRAGASLLPSATGAYVVGAVIDS